MKYSGLVIGGPWAGKSMINDTPNIFVAIYENPPFPWAAPEEHVNVQIKKFHYRHRFLLSLGDDDGIDAWIPHDWTTRSAIEEVFRKYAARVQQSHQERR